MLSLNSQHLRVGDWRRDICGLERSSVSSLTALFLQRQLWHVSDVWHRSPETKDFQSSNSMPTALLPIVNVIHNYWSSIGPNAPSASATHLWTGGARQTRSSSTPLGMVRLFNFNHKISSGICWIITQRCRPPPPPSPESEKTKTFRIAWFLSQKLSG